MDNDDDFIDGEQDVAATRLTGVGAKLSYGRFSAIGAMQAANQLTSSLERVRQFTTGLPRLGVSLAASSPMLSIIESSKLFAAGQSRFDTLFSASDHAASVIERSRLFAAGLPRLNASFSASSEIVSILDKSRVIAAGLPRFDPSFVTSSHAASIIEKSRLFAASLSRVDIPRLSVDQFAAMQSALSNFGRMRADIFNDAVSDSFLSEPFDEISLSSLDISSLENDLSDSIIQLNKVDDRESYLSIFKSLPKSVRWLFYCFFIYVLWPHAVNISSNLLTPIVESYISDKNLTQREKIREIKHTPLKLTDFDTEGLRFITGNYVRLRAEPSIKSEVLGELMLGQIVTVVSKNKNWIEVMYECEDGTLLSGWVFTRYTSRFVK